VEKEPKIKMANGFEIKRKIVHILFGTIGLILLIYNFLTDYQIFIILCSGFLLSFISKKIKVPIISYCLKRFEKYEDRDLPGKAILFGVTGVLFALRLFPRPIALASISILIFADPISHMVGSNFGKIKSPINKKKNIEGPIAGVLISTMVAWFFVPFYLAFLGASIAMLFESLIIKIQDFKLDDNFTIPLTAGTTMLLILKYLI
jgi:dolichol kinase